MLLIYSNDPTHSNEQFIHKSDVVELNQKSSANRQPIKCENIWRTLAADLRHFLFHANLHKMAPVRVDRDRF